MPFIFNLIYEFNEFQSKCLQDTCGICKFTLSTNTEKKIHHARRNQHNLKQVGGHVLLEVRTYMELR